MSGIISALGGLASASWKAFIGIVLAFIFGTIISIFVGASFDIVSSTVQDDSAASDAVEAGRAVYDFGSFVQDVVEYGKWVGVVGGAIFGVYVAVKKALDR